MCLTAGETDWGRKRAAVQEIRCGDRTRAADLNNKHGQPPHLWGLEAAPPLDALGHSSKRQDNQSKQAA